jgi:hypothetical protein
MNNSTASFHSASWFSYHSPVNHVS